MKAERLEEIRAYYEAELRSDIVYPGVETENTRILGELIDAAQLLDRVEVTLKPNNCGTEHTITLSAPGPKYLQGH